MASTIKDDITGFVQQITATDTMRAKSLRSSVDVSDLERQSLEFEAKRLTEKYGAESAQVSEAQARLNLLATERRALVLELARALLAVPVLKEGEFVVYGYVRDANGAAVKDVKVAAVAANKSVLASASSDESGVYELRVHVKEGRIVFQVQLTSKKASVVLPEELIAVSNRMALRDLELPPATDPPPASVRKEDAPKPAAAEPPKVTPARKKRGT